MHKFFLTVLLALPLAAQTTNPPAAPGTIPDALPILAQLQQVSQTAAIDVGRLHIDKWSKSVREQAAHDADTVRNDVTNTLPNLLGAAQAQPNNVAPALAVYTNVNALYEVLDGLASQASTGPKEDQELLLGDLENLRAARKAWADRLQLLAQARDIAAAHSPQTADTKTLPKKIVVDDTAPTHKRTTKSSTKKKTTAQKPPASTPPQ
jgi:hypothetical protein